MKDVLEMNSPEFSQWLIAMRKRYNISQHRISGLLGIFPEQVAGFEDSGFCRPVYRQELIRFFSAKGNIEVKDLKINVAVKPQLRASWVRHKREEHSLMQKELAEMIGIEHSRLSHWERGDAMISDDMFRKLEQLFVQLDRDNEQCGGKTL